MKRLLSALTVTILLLQAFTGAVLADGMILPEALAPDYLSVRYHHVTVTIEDQHAVTHVEQEFYNPHDSTVTGRYLFPLPPGAMISGFRAEVDGKQQNVARQGTAETNAALNASVTRRRDPSLLQYADWESLAFDLEIPAGGSRTMVLEYEELLAPEGGMYRYHYVLSTERYSAMPLDSVSLTVDVRSSQSLGSLYSPAHAVVTERLDANRARVTWQDEYTNPTEDFDLYFAPTEGGFGGGLLTGTHEGEDHFLFLFAPESRASRDVLPKDIVFVVDRSGSMTGEKIEQAQNALEFILGQLGSGDRFSIVAFDDRIVKFSPSLQPATRETRDAARAFVRDLYADTNTDIYAALQEGLRILERSEARPEAPRLIVFLTDGLPTAGNTDEYQIGNMVAEANARLDARLHVFGVGYDVNTHLLDRLAADNGGSVTYVQPGENLELVLSDFYRQIAAPVLTDVAIEFEGLEAEGLYPPALPDLFDGTSLLISGRYRATGDRVTVRVSGRAGDREERYLYRFDLRETGDHAFVPRLWATRRVGQLLDVVRVEGESEARIAEIRALGLSYGLVTPYTTFVIAAQQEGAASWSNMGLYDDQRALNSASGDVTVQARVQNQMYQNAAQANLATGANVHHQGRHNLVQVAYQNVDLTLLNQGQALDQPIDYQWVAENVKSDRLITFGSEEYFELAEDPAARPFLQSGTQVIFAYAGEVVEIVDPEAPDPESYSGPEPALQNSAPGDDPRIAQQNAPTGNSRISPQVDPASQLSPAPARSSSVLGELFRALIRIVFGR